MEGIVFTLSLLSGLVSLSLLSVFSVTLLVVLSHNLLHKGSEDASDRISRIVRHLEADPDDLRNFLVQSKASHLTLKLQPSVRSSDSTRWLNSLIAKLWPMGEIEAAELLNQLGASRRGRGFEVGGFRVYVDHFSLGRRPPVVSRIFVGDGKQTKRHEVSIEVDVAYDGNCRVSFTHPVVGIADFKVGLKDIGFQGNAEIVLRPLVDDMPLVAGVVFCFLNTPRIEFDGTSLLNLIDNRLVKNALETIITGLMVRPNKLYITLTKHERQKRKIILPDVKGLCYLNLICGRHLKTPRATLANKRTVDPMVLIRIADTFFQSPMRKDDPNPSWTLTQSAPFTDLLETVSLRVFDRNTRDRDDFLGEAVLSIHSLYRNNEVNGRKIWTRIDGNSLSSLQFRLACVPVKRHIQTLKQTLALKKNLPVGFPIAVVSVYIHNLRTYPGIEAHGAVAPFVQLKYGHKSHTTGPFPKNENDVPRKVDDGCHFVLTEDPRNELLHILAINGKKTSPSSVSSAQHVYRPDQILASRSLNLSGILQAEDMKKEVRFNLYRGNMPIVKISMFVGVAATAPTPALVRNLSDETEITVMVDTKSPNITITRAE